MDKSKLHIVAVNGMIHRGGKFLIVKRNDEEIAFPGKWQIPGGKLEAEENCKDCLMREVMEETGLKVKNLKLLKDYEFTRPDGHHVVGIVFLCDWESGEVKLSDAHTDFKWVTVEEAKEYDLIPNMWERQFLLVEKIMKEEN